MSSGHFDDYRGNKSSEGAPEGLFDDFPKNEVASEEDKSMANNPLGCLEIYVQDMERAQKFHAAVLEGPRENLSNAEVEM